MHTTVDEPALVGSQWKSKRTGRLDTIVEIRMKRNRPVVSYRDAEGRERTIELSFFVKRRERT